MRDAKRKQAARKTRATIVGKRPQMRRTKKRGYSPQSTEQAILAHFSAAKQKAAQVTPDGFAE